MADVVFLLVILGFFTLCALYVRGCERLISRSRSAELARDGVPEKVTR